MRNQELKAVHEWCSSIVGPCAIVSGNARFHGRTSVCRLQTSSGDCYLKVYGQTSSWEREVHFYEHWAPAFGTLAPPLLGVHECEPFALLVGELAGQMMENVQLSLQQERRVWHAAGQALAGLHGYAKGACFGPCRRDGRCAGASTTDAIEYVATELDRQVEQGIRCGLLDDEELAVIRTARGLLPAFAGERPVPCHRDYGPANWLVTPEGAFAGVIDFEFSYWDVRVADLSRYPNWEWMHRPDLTDAFMDGYGRPLTPMEEQQCLVAHTQYALGAILWGAEHSYHGFEREGREALAHIRTLLG